VAQAVAIAVEGLGCNTDFRQRTHQKGFWREVGEGEGGQERGE
jgi:hypothetical protein